MRLKARAALARPFPSEPGFPGVAGVRVSRCLPKWDASYAGISEIILN